MHLHYLNSVDAARDVLLLLYISLHCLVSVVLIGLFTLSPPSLCEAAISCIHFLAQSGLKSRKMLTARHSDSARVTRPLQYAIDIVFGLRRNGRQAF